MKYVQDHRQHAIGMFDSGIGGLTVMKELIQLLPHENFTYFGDTARLPYGNKSKEAIVRYSIENTIFLMEQTVKLIVVACNTASAYALDKLTQTFNLPVVGVIEPGADAAVKVSAGGRIAVLGTKGTINSQAYQQAILKRNPHAEVLSIACPLFVPIVEEQFIHHPAAALIVRDYLKPVKEGRFDTVLLGCTHYPLLRELIIEELGQEIAVVDSASCCAKEVADTLQQRHLFSTASRSACRFFVSDDPQQFQKGGEKLLGAPIQSVESISKFSI